MSFGMAGITGSVLLVCLLCFIGQTNANNTPDITQSVYEVCEDIPVGQVAFTIKASDTENDPLTYSLVPPNDGYFTLNPATGVATVARPLDRENGDVIKLGATVSDGFTTSGIKDLTIVLKDANDNRPIFQNSSYDCTVEEDTAVGTSLFQVQATDADSGTNGVVVYSIDEVTPSDGFSLFSIVQATGVVKLNGPLDYTSKSTYYQLKIKASDLGISCDDNTPASMSNIVYSFITVKDVPDLDPEFLRLPYMGKVVENSSVSQSVFKVTARDQDIGVNDAMIYSIEKSTAEGLFEISPHDGVITVKSKIDREVVGDTVDLTVKATETNPNIHGVQASTTTNVQISIIDINDNKPEFYKCGEVSCVPENSFTGEVLEHSLGSVSINMTVKDADMMSETQLKLEGADKDVFSVQPDHIVSKSVVQLLVKEPQKLDFEKTQQMVLTVIATDKDNASFHSTATVTIDITDSNDNSPTFPQDTYKLEVPEHSAAGTIIANITAEDPDTMDQGNITYRLLPESILLYFDVNPRDGTIFVKNATLLDREVRSLYSATLQARDTDQKPGSAVLEITLTDINDKPPVFNRDSYLVFVKEGGTFELKIEATDADDPDTENSQIMYGLKPSKYSANFTINPDTGVLTNKGKLDREAVDPDLDGRTELNVTATDKGEGPLSATVTVIVNIEDINDNEPQFEASSYKFSVKEGEKGAFIGSVYARDLDQTTDFNRISFSIIDGGFGSFAIRSFPDNQSYMGNISVDQDIELDYESTRKNFNLRVEASDLDGKNAVVMVEVTVLDVNDERPEFGPTVTVTVKENTTITGAVGNFTAWDKDGDHSLVYELESMKCHCNNSQKPCDSFILEPSGEVIVNPQEKLDYEQCDQVVIEAQVVDVLTEKGENNSVTTGKMVINIEDINDNAPRFILEESVFVVVSESASKDTSVAGVTATDDDSGINSQIEFKVTAVQFVNTDGQTSDENMLFQAVTTQQKDIYAGIIQTTQGLDIKLRGKYLVTVTATDTGGLSTSTTLEIFTVDERFQVELEFTLSVDEVEKERDEIRRTLMAATKTDVQIVSWRPATGETRASSNTVIVAYFVYINGTALTSEEVDRKLSAPEHYLELEQLGLTGIGKAPVNEPKENTEMFILLGMVGGLVIVLAVLTTSLLCTRRNYRRKLKAAKAMNSASMVVSDNQKSGPVVPGTNKYTMGGTNPVFNINIDPTMDLGLDGESSDDKVSLNSLDYSNDMDLPEKQSKSITMIQEEDEEDYDPPPSYIEPLGAALAQHGEKKVKENPLMGYNNPAFDTTDL